MLRSLGHKSISSLALVLVSLSVIACGNTGDDGTTSIPLNKPVPPPQDDRLTVKLNEWQEDCPTENYGDLLRTRTDTSGYQGLLFDAHVHLVGSKDIKNTWAEDDRLHINPSRANEILRTLEQENIIGLIGFLPIIHEYFDNDDTFNRDYIDGTIHVLEHTNNIVPFLHPKSHIGIPPNKHANKLLGFIDQNFKEAGIQFKGIGEIHTSYPQTDSYENMRLVDQVMLDLYDYAAANNLIMMIHPELDNMADLHEALNYNPNTLFLVHGIIDSGAPELSRDNALSQIAAATIADPLNDLFTEHENVYFSIDAALMLGHSLMDACMYDKTQFIKTMQSERLYQTLLNDSVALWKPVIEAHPKRILWGTDLYYWWHYEPEVVHEIVLFARDFISHLDPNVQEGFAYRNALEMLNVTVDDLK